MSTQFADPGASAPSSLNINYDQLLSTTLMAYRRTMVDNIFKANAFLAALRMYGGIDYQDGGERIQQALMYEENDTVKSYRGYEVIDVKPQDGITSAFYEWCEIAGTISISRREERQNSGESAILRLLEQKIKQAEMSIKAAVNKQLIGGTIGSTDFVPGNGAKDMLPLAYFMPKNVGSAPDSGGDVGNIARETYDWWRPNSAVLDNSSKDTNGTFAVDVTTWKGLTVALRRMYNYCTRGADGTAPNLVVSDQESYEVYEAALDEKVRYTDTKLADMGFDNIKIKGATIIWDELTPNVDESQLATYGSHTATVRGTMFFINTAFYKLTIDKQTDFITTPFIEPENQTAKTAKVLFMGNACVSNPRKLGVAYAIDTTLVA